MPTLGLLLPSNTGYISRRNEAWSVSRIRSALRILLLYHPILIVAASYRCERSNKASSDALLNESWTAGHVAIAFLAPIDFCHSLRLIMETLSSLELGKGMLSDRRPWSLHTFRSR